MSDDDLIPGYTKAREILSRILTNKKDRSQFIAVVLLAVGLYVLSSIFGFSYLQWLTFIAFISILHGIREIRAEIRQLKKPN